MHICVCWVDGCRWCWYDMWTNIQVCVLFIMMSLFSYAFVSNIKLQLCEIWTMTFRIITIIPMMTMTMMMIIMVNVTFSREPNILSRGKSSRSSCYILLWLHMRAIAIGICRQAGRQNKRDTESFDDRERCIMIWYEVYRWFPYSISYTIYLCIDKYRFTCMHFWAHCNNNYFLT